MPVLKVKTADNDWVAVGGRSTGSSGSGTGGGSYTLPIANAAASTVWEFSCYNKYAVFKNWSEV